MVISGKEKIKQGNSNDKEYHHKHMYNLYCVPDTGINILPECPH